MQLKAVNNKVTGCQFKRNRDFHWEDDIVPEPTYYDCIFFKDIQLTPAKDSHRDTTFSCLVLTETPDVNNYTQIRPISRETGFALVDEVPVSWLSLRLPENDQIKTRLRQVVIDKDLGNKPPDFHLEVLVRSWLYFWDEKCNKQRFLTLFYKNSKIYLR